MHYFFYNKEVNILLGDEKVLILDSNFRANERPREKSFDSNRTDSHFFISPSYRLLNLPAMVLLGLASTTG
jgi:hypothetical protein